MPCLTVGELCAIVSLLGHLPFWIQPQSEQSHEAVYEIVTQQSGQGKSVPRKCNMFGISEDT